MFYLGGTEFPQTPAELAQALIEGFKSAFIWPGESAGVRVEGSSLEALNEIRIDLTGASARLGAMPPPPRGTGARKHAADVEQFRIEAHPLRVETAGVDLTLEGQGVSFDYDRDDVGKPLLLFASARSGNVAIEITKSDLDQLVLAAAKAGAARQGAQIQKASLSLSQLDPTTIAFSANVTAKKAIMSATIVIEGKLSIDSSLNVTVSDLSCNGQGMMGNMACGFIRPHLEKINNQPFSLASLSLGGVRLHDLRVTAGESLRITAALGS